MSSFANEVNHGRCSCVEYDVEEIQSMLGASSTISRLPTRGRMTSKAGVVKREKKQYILLTLVASFMLCAVVVLMKQSTTVQEEDEVDVQIHTRTTNEQLA
ncbi:predicted protein [Chaetoceros tenuissimus]|uniref:Transmembrane protein n=1 Tax=Chaetoceros tenuissimus TaxID=426638 RepID=A0AAD3CQ25_9STRA|nr:predicted protein [Chaetoceros tenuissimus]